jgi:hypothetical protein
MNQSDKNNASQTTLSSERRTHSIDEYSLQMLSDEYYGTGDKYVKNGLSNGHQELMTQNSNDDYVCVLLPRTNNRPSAKMCW